jgi:hypothetical protein
VGSDYTWTVKEGGGRRELVLARPSGYTGTITVQGSELSARLSKEHERPALEEPPHPCPPDELQEAIDECRRRIERRLGELESGHS